MLPKLVLFPNSLSILYPITQAVTGVMEVVKRALEHALVLQVSLECAQEAIRSAAAVGYCIWGIDSPQPEIGLTHRIPSPRSCPICFLSSSWHFIIRQERGKVIGSLRLDLRGVSCSSCMRVEVLWGQLGTALHSAKVPNLALMDITSRHSSIYMARFSPAFRGQHLGHVPVPPNDTLVWGPHAWAVGR